MAQYANDHPLQMYINVTVCSDQGKIEPMNLRIPQAIEVRKFIQTIEKLVGVKLCRQKFQVRIVTRGLIMDEGKRFDDCLVTNGDKIVIMEDT